MSQAAAPCSLACAHVCHFLPPHAAQHDDAGLERRGSVSTVGAVAIGVGGMMGAAIYTLLGLAGFRSSGRGFPSRSSSAGTVSAFSVYSYAKLGAAFPSRGGAGEFLVRGFGNTMIAGLNVFQFLGWIIAMALYGVGFGGYAAGPHRVPRRGRARRSASRPWCSCC